MDEEKYDTVVLPAGGIKGFFLLGGIQAAIDSQKLNNVNKYVGTSIGSIICYLLAIGYTPTEIMVKLYTGKWMEKMQYFNLTSILNGSNVISFTNVQEALEKLTLDKIGKFLTLGKLKETLGKTLICTTYNMTSCMTEYLGPENYPDLPCLTALRMSANIPIVFDRFKYMDCYYIDGGMTDSFPILKGEEIGQKVLGIYFEVDEKNLRDEPSDGIIAYLLRLWQIPTSSEIKSKIKSVNTDKCTIIPINSGEVRNMLEFDVKSKIKLDMFSTGYNSIKNYFENK